MEEGAGGEATPREAWLRAYRVPVARIGEGRRLARCGVRCGGDVSDGLVADAGRTAGASGCGAELWLDAIPIADGVRESFDDAWMEVALGGGEDFELLCAAPPDLAARVLEAWPPELAPLGVIGQLVDGTGVRLRNTRGGATLATPAVRSRHWG